METDACGCLQGLAPFGADLAVLVYNAGLEGSSPRPLNSLAKAAAGMSGGTASDTVGASTELQHERPELKIFTWAHEEVAADALSITGWSCWQRNVQMACLCVSVRACVNACMRGLCRGQLKFAVCSNV